MARKSTTSKTEIFMKKFEDMNCKKCFYYSSESDECSHPYRYYKDPYDRGCAFYKLVKGE